jgi:predicted DNA binding CopG/RHH family protein
MKYTELLESGATPSEIQSFLTESELASVTIRMPKNLRDSAKEVASLNGMTFTSFVKMCMIEKLSKTE